jgi:hypothetical protein
MWTMLIKALMSGAGVGLTDEDEGGLHLFRNGWRR